MNSIKKNNSGFTLVELLITIVIIGIVAVPFLNSFINAMDINVSARRLQNATLAAQDLAEEFKAEPLSELLDKYAYSITSETDKLDVYKFDTMQVEGIDGEDFFINLELDPNIVYDADGECINGNALPMFSNLYGGDTLIMFKQYVEPDVTVDRATHKKICNINVTCQENALADGKFSYTYTFELETMYEKSDGTRTSAIKKTVEKTYSDTDKHTAYLLAPVFDKYTETFTDVEGNYYATDTINIKYTYLGGADRQKDFTFYLAEQAKKNEGNPEKYSRLNPENINITYGSETKNINVYDSERNKFKINTNTGKKLDDTASEGSLTYDPNNISESLFLMTVEVRYRSEDGKVLTTFTTTKEEYNVKE